MNYNALSFWVTLFVCLSACTLIRWAARPLWVRWGNRLDLYLLALTSCSLFFFCDRTSFCIFILDTLVTYLLLKAALRLNGRFTSVLAAVNILFILSVLFWYKYVHFVISGVLGYDMPYTVRSTIPVGVSFYSFQLIAFIVDSAIRKTSPLPAPVVFLNFLSFFPQIVAGPIERAKGLVPQIERFRYSFNSERFYSGFPVVVLGLFYKFVLADNFAAFVHLEPTGNPYQIWLSLLLFGQRIYFDFAGYSLIAYGCGKFMGVNLSLNFLAPYMAPNIQDFWRRWNVTLLSWFRNYLYIPLGGGRKVWWPLNIMLVWTISGIWHGAGYNYILWGAYHGLLVMSYKLVGEKIPMPALLSRVITFGAVLFSWVLFCETSHPAMMHKITTLITPSGYSLLSLAEAVGSIGQADLLPLFSTVCLALGVYFFEYKNNRKEMPYEGLLTFKTTLVLLSMTVLFSAGSTPKFIYFSF